MSQCTGVPLYTGDEWRREEETRQRGVAQVAVQILTSTLPRAGLWNNSLSGTYDYITADPPSNGHNHFVLCLEVVPSSKVQWYSQGAIG